MLYPRLFGEDLFDDLMDFDFPAFPDFDDTEKKLYGKHAARMMKTDVREKDDCYEVAIDLPGFKKDEITLELQKGYLTVTAAKGLDKDEKDKEGRLLRQERYAGSMQRSFYVGENVTDGEIKARFEDGVLQLTIPRKDAKKIPEKQHILIEG